MDELLFLADCRKQNYEEEDIQKFKRCINFIRMHLHGIKRLSGDSYFEHNIRVASILVDSKAAPETVLTGLLHGILEYVSAEKVKEAAGSEVLQLVEGIIEIKKIKSRSKMMEAEALRKIILTTLKDVRVVLVKIANKLDNLRSIHVFPIKEQKRIATEVLEVYAPLAYRLGMDRMKNQLENISFKIINPRKYQEILDFVKESNEEREDAVKAFIIKVEHLAVGKVDILNIKGRPKQIYSIYRKMTLRKVKLHEQFDLLGVRIIVSDVKDCYTVLGLLHENFDPIPGKLKDYIANPKPNFYRSIHTALVVEGKKTEVQVRTEEMDEFAEEGVAAHWRYKGVQSDDFFEKRISWLKGVIDLQKDNKEFLETARIDVFGDKIHCYTPQGDPKELPFGATVLDFAYLVHEEIGNTTVGARVNGKFVPLRHVLEKNDVVEVVTNKKQRPRRNWIKIVKSGRARQKIRKSLREHDKLIAPLHYRLVKPIVKEEQGVLVESESFPNALCVIAQCCSALPGEPIVGILTKRRVVSIHNEDCRSALKEQDRWVAVNWKETFNQKIRFYVRAEERSGVLADLLHTIASAGFHVKEAKAKLIDSGNVECSFLVIPRDLEELKSLVGRVQKVKGVRRIYFE